MKASKKSEINTSNENGDKPATNTTKKPRHLPHLQQQPQKLNENE